MSTDKSNVKKSPAKYKVMRYSHTPRPDEYGNIQPAVYTHCESVILIDGHPQRFSNGDTASGNSGGIYVSLFGSGLDHRKKYTVILLTEKEKSNA